MALAALTYSFAGFGFALIAVPLLALLMPTKIAVATQFPMMFALNVYVAFRDGKRLQWRQLWPLFSGSCLGIPLGFFLIHMLSEAIVKRTLAVFIVLIVINSRLKWGKYLKDLFASSSWWGVGMGVFSGWLQGAYTTGGPPAVIYAVATMPDPVQTKGFLAIFFLFMNVFVMVPLFYMSGTITGGELLAHFRFTPAVVIGTVIGAMLFRRVNNKGFLLAVDCLLLVTSFLLWFRS
jgi:uncharacterized membrane protein YfcA